MLKLLLLTSSIIDIIVLLLINRRALLRFAFLTKICVSDFYVENFALGIFMCINHYGMKKKKNLERYHSLLKVKAELQIAIILKYACLLS